MDAILRIDLLRLEQINHFGKVINSENIITLIFRGNKNFPSFYTIQFHVGGGGR